MHVSVSGSYIAFALWSFEKSPVLKTIITIQSTIHHWFLEPQQLIPPTPVPFLFCRFFSVFIAALELC
jgi:hypothetical protein